MEIDKLLAMNEGKNIEFKKAKNQLPKAFWETYSAFTNTDGGIIVLGFDENDKANVGIKAPYKMKDDLFNTLNNKQKVSTNVISEDDVIIYTLSNGLAILVIKVKEASYHQKPVYLNNNPQQAYERFGEGDRKLSIEKYKALVVGSHEITDNELLKGFDLTDLNENDLELYRESLLEQTNNTKYSTITHRDMLIEIGALKKDRQGDGEYHLTTGGLLFFGKFNSITDRFPGFQLDYFDKNSSLDTDWNDRVSSGDGGYPELNVYSFFRLIIEKLSSNLRDQFVLDKETQTRLPFKSDLLTALREALVNSLMHAYYDSDSPIRINAYPDYFEFINPGKMRISIEEFIHGGHSNIRNHTMSSIMRRIGISEKAGSGGPRIFDIAEKYNRILPEIKREQEQTVVRVWKIDIGQIFEKYSTIEKQILYYTLENQSISRREANEKLLIEKHTFRNAIDKLLDDEIIERIGNGPATKYSLKQTSLEMQYSIKKLLRRIEDDIS